MARILLSYNRTQEVLIRTVSCYFESLAKELRDQGNDVLMMNTAYFNAYDSNVVVNEQLDKLILDEAIKFDPELIITFYHRVPQCILDYFDGVPVVIWDGDSPYYFCDIEHIKKNIGRYTIFSISKDWYQDYLDIGFLPNAYNYMPNATSVYNRPMEFTMNISFLGSRAYPEMSILSGMYRHEYLPQSKAVVEERLRTGNVDCQYYLDKYFKTQQFVDGWEEVKLYPLFDYRWLVLASVMDMGLTMCGVCWHRGKWENINESMPQLLSTFDPRRVWTLDENIDFYNSSKISLSPLHPQAHGKAFPWRAFDVMASNSCLVLGASSEFAELTGGHVDIPMFESPYEVRDICKKLLENESHRQEIVLASQEWINKNARWEQRFREAEQILGIPLVNLGRDGSICDIIYDNADVYDTIFNAYAASEDNMAAHKEKPKLKVRIGNAMSRAWHKIQNIAAIKKGTLAGVVIMLAGIVIYMLANGYMQNGSDAMATAAKVLCGTGAGIVVLEHVILAIKAMLKVVRHIARMR